MELKTKPGNSREHKQTPTKPIDSHSSSEDSHLHQPGDHHVKWSLLTEAPTKSADLKSGGHKIWIDLSPAFRFSKNFFRSALVYPYAAAHFFFIYSTSPATGNILSDTADKCQYNTIFACPLPDTLPGVFFGTRISFFKKIFFLGDTCFPVCGFHDLSCLVFVTKNICFL